MILDRLVRTATWTYVWDSRAAATPPTGRRRHRQRCAYLGKIARSSLGSTQVPCRPLAVRVQKVFGVCAVGRCSYPKKMVMYTPPRRSLIFLLSIDTTVVHTYGPAVLHFSADVECVPGPFSSPAFWGSVLRPRTRFLTMS